MKFPCPHKFNPADHYIRTLAIVPGKEHERRKRVKVICRFESSSSKYQNKCIDRVDHAKSFALSVKLPKFSMIVLVVL